MKRGVLKKLVKRLAFSQVLVAIFGFFATNAMAMAVPAAGSFAYDLYDIAINSILLGPIGFIAGVGFIVLAAIMAIRNMYVPAGGLVLAAAFMLKADTVVQSFGGMIV